MKTAGRLIKLLALCSSGLCLGKPVIEKIQGAEINWSAQTLRFETESAAVPSASLAEAEASALATAKPGLTAAITELRLSCGAYAGEDAERHASDALKRVLAAAMPTNTTIFSDGRVLTVYESRLTRALLPVGAPFATVKTAEPAKASAMLLKVSGKTAPRPLYQVIDGAGQVLYSVKDLSRDAYYRNLMGRWLSAPGPDELARELGANPVVVSATAKEPGVLVVKDSEWAEAVSGNTALLQDAKIVLQLQ